MRMTFSTGPKTSSRASVMSCCDAIDDRRAEVKTVRAHRRTFTPRPSADDLRAFLLAAGDETQHAVAMLRGDDRAHVGLRRRSVGAADLDGARGFDQRSAAGVRPPRRR